MKVIAIIILGIFVALLSLICFPPIRVEGESMYPTLREGKILIGCRLFNKKKCRIGRLYVIHLRDAENGEPFFVVKRLSMATFEHKNGSKRVTKAEYDFRGDNTEVSYDSRHYGLIPSDKVEAVVLGRFPNMSKKGAN